MRPVVHTVLGAVAALLVVASFLPLIETQWWGVRLLDFPRLPLAIALVVLSIVLTAFVNRAPRTTLALLTGTLSAGMLHAVTLWPYWPSGDNLVIDCPSDRRLSVLVANVQLGNRNAAPLVGMVQDQVPDLFLAMETDEWWDAALRPLAEIMPNRVQKITGSYYGIHLFSRLPLVGSEIRFLAAQDTPAIVTGVTLGTGETVEFIGIHPRPPQPWQSAMGRDAELYAAAFHLRDRPTPGIIAGDLNATPWETAVDRMRRIARLIDPRRGYGYLATFNANSWWAKWPLDHVFHESGFATMSLQRLDAFGSDHNPYLARLCRVTTATPNPPMEREGDVSAAKAALSAAGAEPDTQLEPPKASER